MQIEVVPALELAPERVARWAELQALRPEYDTPYLSPQWAQAVARAQGRRGRGVKVAVMMDGGRDVGFLAANVGPFTALPAGAPMNDYQAVVAESGVRIDPRRLVAALGVQRLDFCHMLASQQAFAPHRRGQTLSHVVDLSEGYEAWAAQRRAAGVGLAKDLDRKRRKAEREAGAVTFEPLSRDPEAFATLLDWKRGQLAACGQTDIFAPQWTRALLADLFTCEAADFGGAFFALRIGGELAALQMNLRTRRVLHAWIIAHNPDFERYSPGLLLFQDMMRWMDGAQFRRLDLGPGEVRFKLELANDGVPVTWGFVGRPSPAAALRTAAYAVREAAEALPLGRASQIPGKAMRRIDVWRGLRSA